MNQSLILQAKQFETHPIISNHHLNPMEREQITTVFQILDIVQKHAELVEGGIVLDESQYSEIVRAFQTAYKVFLEHFKTIQVEVMGGILIPLMNMILSSRHYIMGSNDEIDFAFDAINCRVEEIALYKVTEQMPVPLEA